MPESPAPPRPVITLFESYGSGASYVGPQVAKALGVPFHRQAFSSEEMEGAETRRDEESPVGRVLVAMSGRYSFATLEGGAVVAAQQDDHDLVLENTRTVLENARQGGVIMGRNATRILANRAGTLHVKLDGPLTQRVERAAKDSGISLERAEKRQKQEDALRAQMSIDLYGWDPRELDNYDLVANTGKLDLDTTVQLIVEAFKVKARRPIA